MRRSAISGQAASRPGRGAICREIVHLDLDEPAKPIERRSEAEGLFVIIWQAGRPIGHRDLAGAAMPGDTAALRQLVGDTTARSAPDLGQPSPRDLPHRAETTISVVVCTRDRTESLAACLHSLAAMSRQADEVVVVDNAPTSAATRDLIASRFPWVHYVSEPRAGLDIARNRGIEAARGDILALTDDDVVVERSWLGCLEEAFADPAIMAVMGLILPRQLETPAQWQFEQYWSLNRGYAAATYGDTFFQRFRRYGVPTWDLGAGANMAFRRSVFAAIGMFDERLDAGAAGCSGDSEILYRLLAEGFCCRYDPRAVVHHTHRRSDGEYRRQVTSYMRGHAVALLIQFERYRHWGNIRRLCSILPGFYGTLVLRGLRHGFGGRQATLGAEIAGLLSGVVFYLHHRTLAHDRRRGSSAAAIPD